MKLVQLLANELKEWPEDDEGSDPILFITQNASGEIFSWNDNGELKFADGRWYMQGTIPFDELIFDGSETCSDCSYEIVREDQWYYEREKMNKPKWIRHRGGKCPVADDVKVLYRMRSGTITSRGEPSSILSWDHSKSGADIMAYRVIEETKDQEVEEVIPKHMAFGYASKEEMVAQIGEECPFAQVASAAEKTNFGTITYKLEIDATEATQRIDSLVAKWGQIVSPLKWRDEIIELEAYEEEFRREREKLIRKLESEGFKLIDPEAAPCLRDEWEDMDYESFCVGDTVVCINEKSDDTVAELTIGREYRLILDNEGLYVIDDAGYAMRYCIDIGCFKLVKRA